MRKGIRVLEDQLHLGVRLHAEAAHVVLHLRLHGADDDLLIDLLETFGRLLGIQSRRQKHDRGSKRETGCLVHNSMFVSR